VSILAAQDRTADPPTDLAERYESASAERSRID
jgi:hypothetical protein